MYFTDSTQVVDLKQQIQDQEGTPVAQVVLLFAGKQLDNHRLVVDYNLQSESTLYMLIRAANQDD